MQKSCGSIYDWAISDYLFCVYKGHNTSTTCATRVTVRMIRQSEFDVVKELLATARVLPNGCMAVRGAVDENGFVRVIVNKKKWLAHRLVALYCDDTRSDVQVLNLDKFYVVQSCGLTVCINPKHLEIKTSRPPKRWELLAPIERAAL